jgi:hypothetical protein
MPDTASSRCTAGSGQVRCGSRVAVGLTPSAAEQGAGGPSRVGSVPTAAAAAGCAAPAAPGAAPAAPHAGARGGPPSGTDPARGCHVTMYRVPHATAACMAGSMLRCRNSQAELTALVAAATPRFPALWARQVTAVRAWPFQGALAWVKRCPGTKSSSTWHPPSQWKTKSREERKKVGVHSGEAWPAEQSRCRHRGSSLAQSCSRGPQPSNAALLCRRLPAPTDDVQVQLGCYLTVSSAWGKLAPGALARRPTRQARPKMPSSPTRVKPAGKSCRRQHWMLC